MPDADLHADLATGAVLGALTAITAAEAAGANMTRSQYQDLHAAVSDTLAARPDLTATPAIADLHLDLTAPDDRDLAAWVLTGRLLAAHRGPLDAPSGTHGPWPGTRCVYCGSNSLDVDLYTVDPNTCPPLWACGAHHPDHGTVDDDDWRRFASCRLAPDHPGDHADRHYSYPTAHDPDVEAHERADAAAWGTDVDEATVGTVTAIGPPQLHVHTWPR